MLIYSVIGALFLAFVHLFANKIGFSHIPRSKWLSAAGGISVSYIFIHLLPELEDWQLKFEEKNENLSFISHHLYLVALSGLTAFYGLERAAKLSSDSHREPASDQVHTNAKTFWLHIGSFSLYNAIIGHLLTESDTKSTQELIWFIIAMAFHFIGNDYSLLDHYRHKYLREGRWVMAASVIGGWAMGTFIHLSETVIAVLFAFVAGSVILNVLKEEIPEERKSNFWAFLSGIILYSSILLLTG